MTTQSIKPGWTHGHEDSSPELPQTIERVLSDFGLIGAFQCKPFLHQQGYPFWIGSAEWPEDRDNRIADMLDDLAIERNGANRA
jgi:hypothetical protein